IQASLAAFALMISNGTLAFALPIKVEEMNMTSATTGMLLSVYGIVALVVFLTPLNRIFDKRSPLSLVVLGISFIGFVHIMLNFVNTFEISLMLMVIYGVGFSFVFPSMNRIVTDASSVIERGKA